jgi:hypothetical protein
MRAELAADPSTWYSPRCGIAIRRDHVEVTMKLLPRLGVLWVLTHAAVPFGCSSSEIQVHKAPLDGATGSGGGTSAEAGADTGAPTTGIKCGGVACNTRRGVGIEKLTECCTDANECGLKFPGADAKCLLQDQPGVLSPACSNYAVPDVPTLTLQGCCGPQGCGKNDAYLGCVVNTDLGLAAEACAYDPTNNCQAVAEIPCDGVEDCPAGQHCCTDLGGGAPDQTKCYDTCQQPGSGTWRELCHAGDTCEDPSFQCRVSMALPAWLTRCNNSTMGALAPTNLDTAAGSVNCGDGVCGSGKKCCAVTPAMGAAIYYCEDPATPCKCHPPDAGAPAPRP